MKKLYLLSLLFLAAGWQEATAGLKVKWDCYDPTGNGLSCQSVEQNYFSGIKFLKKESDPKLADLSIKIRTFALQGGTQYLLDFQGKGELPSFKLIEKIPSSQGQETALIRLVTVLHKGTVPYLSILKPVGQDEETGAYTLTLSDPEDSQAQPPGNDTSTRWYISPGLSGNYSRTENDFIQVSASVETNYSSADWRFRSRVSAAYEKIIIRTPGEKDISAEILQIDNTIVMVRTVHKGWSVAMIMAGGHKPGSNLTSYAEASAGVEWNLIPFRTTEDKTLAVRYMIGPRFENYTYTNVMNKEQQLYAQHMAQVYFAWHFDQIDFNATLTGENPINFPKYSSVSTHVNVVWRITSALNLTTYVGAAYQKHYTYEPKQIDYSNPVQTFLSGGNFGDYTVFAGLQLSYVFGNSLLKGQDQRWNIFE